MKEDYVSAESFFLGVESVLKAIAEKKNKRLTLKTFITLKRSINNSRLK